MNGSLTQNIRRLLKPALERSQGFTGSYVRGNKVCPLTMIPQTPDWETEDDHGVIEQYAAVLFLVFADPWAETELGLPQQSDRYTVVLADRIPRTYALLGDRRFRPYDMPAGADHYNLRMKWVKG